MTKLADIDGRPIPDLIVVDTHQEHGVVARCSGGKVSVLSIGIWLRIPSNHACSTGAQHGSYSVVDGKREVLAR